MSLQFVFVCCLIFSQLILVLLFCRYNRLIFCLPREQGFPRQKTIVSQAGNKCFLIREWKEITWAGFECWNIVVFFLFRKNCLHFIFYAGRSKSCLKNALKNKGKMERIGFLSCKSVFSLRKSSKMEKTRNASC